MDQKMADYLFGDVTEQGDAVQQRADDLRELAEAGVLPQDVEPDVWAEDHPEPTDREIEMGNDLGKIIDIDDDEDNGGFA